MSLFGFILFGTLCVFVLLLFSHAVSLGETGIYCGLGGLFMCGRQRLCVACVALMFFFFLACSLSWFGCLLSDSSACAGCCPLPSTQPEAAQLMRVSGCECAPGTRPLCGSLPVLPCTHRSLHSALRLGSSRSVPADLPTREETCQRAETFPLSQLPPTSAGPIWTPLSFSVCVLSSYLGFPCLFESLRSSASFQ